MDVMLQKHCSKYVYVIPEGLRELMSDICREVLRSQPNDMYRFIADYLDALMITRENARVAVKLVQNITDMATVTVDLLERTGMEREEANKVAAIIQINFMKQIEYRPSEVDAIAGEDDDEDDIITEIINQANITFERAEDAAKIIQLAYRNFKQRQERERQLLSGMVDWRVAARSAIQLYRKTGVTHEEANRAATMIKAAYKGYYTRRILHKLDAQSTSLRGAEDTLQPDIVEYLHYDVEPEDDSSDDLKSVRINYDTVIPHVAFDDPKIIREVNFKSSSQIAASNILDSILKALPTDSNETLSYKRDKPATLENLQQTPHELKVKKRDEMAEGTTNSKKILSEIEQQVNDEIDQVSVAASAEPATSVSINGDPKSTENGKAVEERSLAKESPLQEGEVGEDVEKPDA